MEQAQMIYDDYSNGISLTQLQNKYGICRHVISRELKKYHFHISGTGRKFTVNEKYFEKIDSSEKAYWLGFIAADGSISHPNNDERGRTLTFNLNERDKNHLEKFKLAIQSNANVKIQDGTGYGQGTKIAHLEINSIELISDLKKYGIVRNKSNILKPPNIETCYYKDWIRGYLDGDGSISILANGKLQISFVGTKEVLDFIQIFFTNKLAKKYGKRYPDRDNNNYNLKFGGTTSIVKYLHKIYDNSHISLDRKYQKVLEIFSRFEKQFSKV